MTNKEFDGIFQMVEKILNESCNLEEVIDKIEDLRRKGRKGANNEGS